MTTRDLADSDPPIVDVHSHVWPVLAEHPENAVFLQRHTIWHTQQPRRLRDGRVNAERMLYDGRAAGRSNLTDVGFRFGRFGRSEWEHEGETYYLQWMPELMETMVMPAESMISLMNNVGVHWGVISRGHSYGDINHEVAQIVQAHKGRFVGCAQIQEWRADHESQHDELRRSVKIGLSALYFETEAFFMDDYRLTIDDRRLDRLWEIVAELGIPVLWDIRPRHSFTPEDFNSQVRALSAWADRWPTIPSVLTHAFNMAWFDDRRLSADVVELLRRPQMYVELLFPIMMGRLWEYPYAEAGEAIRQLREEVGTDRMMWGSDMPAAQRVCTYRQALDYIRIHCDWLPPQEREAILGTNASRLFRLPRPAVGHDAVAKGA